MNSGQATVNDRDQQGATPLHWAAISNHVVVARFLIDAGADVNAVGSDLMATPLHWAARFVVGFRVGEEDGKVFCLGWCDYRNNCII